MPTTLTEIAQEKSTYIVTLNFQDEDGNAVVPASISWSLTDDSNNIMNSLSSQSETPASTIYVVLSGDDLQISTTETELPKVGNRNTVRRHLVVEASYDSVTYGNGLNLNDSAVFLLEDLKKVS